MRTIAMGISVVMLCWMTLALGQIAHDLHELRTLMASQREASR